MTHLKIKVVVVRPFKEPRIENILGELKTFQNIVKGRIETTYDDKLSGMIIVCNEDNKFNNLTFNRKITTGGCEDFLFGTFFVCGDGVDDFVSLTDAQIKQVLLRFKYPPEKENAHSEKPSE